MPPPVLSKANVGFFGKLPSTGDFVARGLSQGLRPFLDQWLTRGLAARRDTPDTWSKDGVRAVVRWNRQWLILLVLPSADKPDRKFPFVICRIAAFAPDRESADGWCNSVLDLARDAIAMPMQADDVIQALAKVIETDLTPNAETDGDTIWHVESELIPIPDSGFAQALDRLFPATS